MQTKPKPLLITAALLLFLISSYRLLFFFPNSLEPTTIIQILADIAAGILAIVLMTKSPRKYGIALLIISIAGSVGGISLFLTTTDWIPRIPEKLIIPTVIIPAIYIVCLILAYAFPKIPFCFILLALSIAMLIFEIINFHIGYPIQYWIRTNPSPVHAAVFLISLQIWRDARKQNQII
jgi:hypothetical protein